MVLKYVISPYPELHDNLIVQIWEAQSDGPGAWVYEQIIPEAAGGGGHPSPETIVVNGLDKVVHIVRLYAAGNLLHEYNAEPLTENLAVVFDPIFFKIGDGGLLTPAANSNTYANPVLAGLADVDYMVRRNQYGTLFPGVHYTNNNVTGGFSLALPGDVFNDQEEFVIERKIQPVTPVNDSVVGKWFGGFVDIAADTVYDAAHLRKLIRFSVAVGNTSKYTFPVGINPPIGYGFVIQNQGLGGVGRVEFLNAPLLWGNGTRTTIDLPQFSQALFTFDGANWNVGYLCESKWVAGGATPPGSNIAAGRFYVGNLPGGDPEWDVVHNLNIAGDYLVMLSLQSNTGFSRGFDNDVIAIWYHHPSNKPNAFRICAQEKASGNQDLFFCWLIIKL